MYILSVICMRNLESLKSCLVFRLILTHKFGISLFCYPNNPVSISTLVGIDTYKIWDFIFANFYALTAGETH